MKLRTYKWAMRRRGHNAGMFGNIGSSYFGNRGIMGNTGLDTTALTTPMGTSTVATNTTATDDSLRTQLKDATKDYPNVIATVNDREATLTGNIISKANDQWSLIRTEKGKVMCTPNICRGYKM